MRERPDAAAAAAAPSTAPSGAFAGGSEQESPPEREGSAGAQGDPTARLTRVTADRLRGWISASGKKATLVNAWASWCGPCRREVPMLQALAANLKLQGVDVVLVSVDDPKDEPKALSFLKDNHVTLKSYLVDGDMGDFKAGINPRWPGMLPASFLFDARGGLVHFWAGEAFESEIVNVVEAFVSGRPIEAETRYGLAPGKVQ